MKNLSEAINQCLQRAGDCARKAAAESDPKIKADFLDTKRRWTALARNYEFAKRLTDGAKQNDKLPKVRTGTNKIYARSPLPAAVVCRGYCAPRLRHYSR